LLREQPTTAVIPVPILISERERTSPFFKVHSIVSGVFTYLVAAVIGDEMLNKRRAVSKDRIKNGTPIP
jgi:hypothetical protein